jgi:hypothetical protein
VLSGELGFDALWELGRRRRKKKVKTCFSFTLRCSLEA